MRAAGEDKRFGIKCFGVEKDMGKDAEVAFFPFIFYNKNDVHKTDGFKEYGSFTDSGPSDDMTGRYGRCRNG